MKNQWIKLLMVLICWVPETGFGQEMPNVIPPSPEASSMGKFGEIPVSHYSGVPNISVPITSVSVGDKTFPISINYHSRGIQVSEIASRAGLGWGLNAGGAISRKTMFRPDESQEGYANGGDGFITALKDGSFYSDKNVRKRWTVASTDREPDYYPDQFMIEAAGLSFKFYINYMDLSKPLVQKYDDIKVQFGPEGNEEFGGEFVVTDSDGYKYYFGISKDRLRIAVDSEEVIRNYSFMQSSGEFRNAPERRIIKNSWKLMDIESPSGELLSFFYTSETLRYFRRSYDDYINDSGAPQQEFVNYSSEVVSVQNHVSRIKHKNGYVYFDSDTDNPRLDVSTAYRLKKIRIENVKRSEKKSFELYHTYRNAKVDDNQNYALKGKDGTSSYRLFLDSIVERGEGQFSKPAMIFEYDNQLLPNRFSNSIDFWGMYNGADNGQFLSFYNYGLKEFDRTVDTVKSEAGMLKKITYPTGGYTKFLYEHNIGKLGQSFENVLIPVVNPTVEKETYLGHLMFEDGQIYNGQYYETQFTIGNSRLDHPIYNISFGDPTKCSSEHVTADCDFDVLILGTNFSASLLMGEHILSGIVPGTYTLRVVPRHQNHNPLDMINNPHHSFTVQINWKEAIDMPQDEIYASGKRIHKIENYNGDGQLSSFKEYKYQNPITSRTSGKILGLSNFTSILPKISSSGYEVTELLGALPGSPLSTYQGNTIGYEYVQEYYGDLNNNYGKTEYVFTVQEDTGEYNRFPYHPPTDNEWLRGQPLEVTYYKSINSALYKKVKSVFNEYFYAGDIMPLIFTPPPARYSDIDNNHNVAENAPLATEGLGYHRDKFSYRLPLAKIYQRGLYQALGWGYKIFHFTGGAYDKVKSTETFYDDNQDPIFTTETETKFNYENQYKPSSVITSSSDGNSIIQTFKYPVESDSLGRKHANIIVPIEVATYKDTDGEGDADESERLSFTRTKYNDQNKPGAIFVAKGTANPELRLVFDKYDADGNLLQAHKPDGINIIYLYSYNNSLPVAKIETSKYDYDGFLDEMADQTLSIYSDLYLQGKFQEKIKDAMITTYTYDPLVGMTSMTDPSGVTVYYEYDELGRLKYTKDEDGNILTETHYQYGQ